MCDQPQSFKIWLLGVILLLGLLAFFMWLGLRPKVPTYSILDLTVPVSNTTSTANQTMPNGTLSFSLDIDNPNQESSIFYDDILLMFNYNEEAIGDNKIPYFHQEKGKSTRIKDRIDINARTLQKVMDAISNKGTSSLKVNLKTSIRYKTWGIRSKHHKMYMEGVVIVGSDGKIQGKKKKIKLKHAFKKWKRINFH
ncbi:hypothetical protein LguiA_015099 [Lonicera macranthoides]